MENSAFTEIVNRNLDLKPKYVGIFVLKGFVDDSLYIPAHFVKAAILLHIFL